MSNPYFKFASHVYRGLPRFICWILWVSSAHSDLCGLAGGCWTSSTLGQGNKSQAHHGLAALNDHTLLRFHLMTEGGCGEVKYLASWVWINDDAIRMLISPKKNSTIQWTWQSGWSFQPIEQTIVGIKAQNRSINITCYHGMLSSSVNLCEKISDKPKSRGLHSPAPSSKGRDASLVGRFVLEVTTYNPAV